MIIYTETVLNMMVAAGRDAEVREIIRIGIHRNRKCGNYIIVKDK
jgi:hypothetical protein